MHLRRECRLAPQHVIHGPGMTASPGSSVEMQLQPSILIKNVHLNHIPDGFAGTFPFVKSGRGREWG